MSNLPPGPDLARREMLQRLDEPALLLAGQRLSDSDDSGIGDHSILDQKQFELVK